MQYDKIFPEVNIQNIQNIGKYCLSKFKVQS